MAIKKITISNFKSFKELKVELGMFNVLIGANASGKSNFIQIFKFLRDITNYGLDNAISMQGDVEYLRNVNIGSSMNYSLEVVADQRAISVLKKNKKLIGVEASEGIYKFAMGFDEKGLGVELLEDRLTQKCRFVRLEERKGEIKEKEELGTGEIVFSKVGRKLNSELRKPRDIPIEKEDIVFPSPPEEEISPKTLFIEKPFHLMSLLFPPFATVFNNISIYDFDPKLSPKASPITGKADLEEDGQNLAIVLKKIIGDENRKRKFSNLIKDLLPFVEDLDVEKFADKSLLLKFKESYAKDRYLPAFLMSDGTINITALIIALYFEKNPLTIIEEPERNIHPSLISKVVDMMKEASKDKQVIVTTHNPEIVKHAGLENILLITRDREGFSTISKPSDKEEVKTFLKNEIGIEELYVQNLLGV